MYIHNLQKNVRITLQQYAHRKLKTIKKFIKILWSVNMRVKITASSNFRPTFFPL